MDKLSYSDLICCDGCEKAYHADCINVDEDKLPDIWYGPCCEKRSAKKVSARPGEMKTSVMNATKATECVAFNKSTVHAPAKSSPKGESEKSGGGNFNPSKQIITNSTAVKKTMQIGTKVIQNVKQQPRPQPCVTNATEPTKEAMNTTKKVMQHPTRPFVIGKSPSLYKTALPQCKEPSLSTTTTPRPYIKPAEVDPIVPPSKQSTFRTVRVPPGVSEGSMFHVLLEGGLKIGAVCPNGVQPGQTIVLLEPECHSAPMAPEKIVAMNEARLLKGFENVEASVVKRIFWGVLFPRLKARGWSMKRETKYNFGAYTFCWAKNSVTKQHMESISDVLKAAMSDEYCKDAVELFYSSIEQHKLAIKQKQESRKRKRLEEMNTDDQDKKIGIGINYQVRSIPRAGTHELGSSNEYM